MLKFDLPKNQSSIIKVIGVGGGGSNAVNHMFRQGIKGVDFIICNTDAQAMESSPVPVKIQLGANLTGGLGAGAVPSIGKNAALENVDDIRRQLETGTKMLFVTAGLGGGTGTGAAPVIASISKELGILTVGIVTIPFSFEGRKRRQHADQGIAELKKYVDALLIICNDKLRLLYGDQRLSAAFAHADNVLTNAAKGIAEIITVTGYINVDFEDVKTVMKDSGVAIMGTGIANGEDRARKAIEMALNSPLLNDNDIEGANNLLLYITSGTEEITMDEVTEITDYIQEKTKNSAEVIWGNGSDESLADNISITLIATGFDEEHRRKDMQTEKVFTRKHLYDDPEDQKEEIIRVPVVPEQEPEPEPEKQTEPVAETVTEPVPGDEKEPETIDTQQPEDEPVSEEADRPERTFVFDVGKSSEENFDNEMQQEKENTDEKEVTSEPGFRFFTRPAEKPVVAETRTLQDTSTTPVTEPKPLENPGDLSLKHNERVRKLKALSEKLKSHMPLDTHLAEIENVPAYKRRNVELQDVAPSSESEASRYTLSQNSESTIEIRTENTFLNKNVD